MNTNLARKTAFRRPAVKDAGRKVSLRVVPEQTGSASLLLAMISVVVVIAIVVIVPLLINTSMAMTSYSVHDYEVELARVEQDNEMLRTEVNEAASPQHLRKAAAAAGLVPAGETGNIELHKQKVTGGTPAR